MDRSGIKNISGAGIIRNSVHEYLSHEEFAAKVRMPKASKADIKTGAKRSCGVE
jgi:hypothetical protein